MNTVKNSQKDNYIILYTLGNTGFQGFLFWKKYGKV
nr:MAG TPA: hypothetical protein [Caudoviricetes sp.]